MNYPAGAGTIRRTTVEPADDHDEARDEDAERDEALREGWQDVAQDRRERGR